MTDVDEIRRLKYRYLRTLDTRDWEGFAACFTSDATADYGGLAFAGPGQLVDYLQERMGPGMITMHQAHHPEIEVDGDSATGRWYLQDKVIVPRAGFMLEGAAFYEDHYRLTSAGWRIRRTGYRRTYEMTYDLTDLPGIKITAGGLLA